MKKLLAVAVLAGVMFAVAPLTAQGPPPPPPPPCTPWCGGH